MLTSGDNRNYRHFPPYSVNPACIFLAQDDPLFWTAASLLSISKFSVFFLSLIQISVLHQDSFTTQGLCNQRLHWGPVPFLRSYLAIFFFASIFGYWPFKSVCLLHCKSLEYRVYVLSLFVTFSQTPNRALLIRKLHSVVKSAQGDMGSNPSSTTQQL